MLSFSSLTLRRALVFGVLTLIVVAMLPLTAAPTQAATTPRYEPAKCWFDAPIDPPTECGYLVVPEDRTAQNDKTIKVAVMRMKAAQSTDDPLVFLQGGPGGPAIESLGLPLGPQWIKEFNRDLIVIDQRGVGRSEPALTCQEYTDASYEVLNKRLSPQENIDLTVKAFSTCRDRLLKSGVNLSAFNNIQNAADVADLARALNIPKLNIYGVSYGTTLALTVMRNHPEVVRSVVLDSVAPPAWDQISAPVAQLPNVYARLFNACAENSACNQVFPNLNQTFTDTVKKLNDTPVTLKVPHPKTKKVYDVLVTGDAFAGQIFNALYLPPLFIAGLPGMITDVSKGKYESLTALMNITLFQFEEINWPMYYSVLCSSEYPFTSADAVKSAASKLPPALVGLGEGDSTLPVCSKWGVKAAPAYENTPVTSDLPTLLVAGDLDPITPPDLAKEAAKTLKNSYLFTFKGFGHGVIPNGGCGFTVMASFLNAPTQAPDAACVADLKGVTFNIPAANNKIEFEPYTSDLFKLSGLKPKGWKELTQGVFNQNQATVLLQQAIPQKMADTLALLTKQLQQSTAPEVKSVRKANGLDWNLYEFTVQGIPIDMALAEKNGRTAIVLLQCVASDREYLYTNLFLPLVDALKITN